MPTADGPVLVAVVCDGVSTSARPQDASLAAAQAAARVLRAAAEAGTDLSEASTEAVRAAVEAVSGLADSPGEVGSATFISAAATKDAVTAVLGGRQPGLLAGRRARGRPAADPGRFPGPGDGLARAAAGGGGARVPAGACGHALGGRGPRRGEAARHPLRAARDGRRAALLRRAVELPARGGGPGRAGHARRAGGPARLGQGAGAVRHRRRRPGQHHRGADPLPARHVRLPGRLRQHGSPGRFPGQPSGRAPGASPDGPPAEPGA